MCRSRLIVARCLGNSKDFFTNAIKRNYSEFKSKFYLSEIGVPVFLHELNSIGTIVATAQQHPQPPIIIRILISERFIQIY